MRIDDSGLDLRVVVERGILEQPHYHVCLNSMLQILSHTSVQVLRAVGRFCAHPELTHLPKKNTQHKADDPPTLIMLILLSLTYVSCLYHSYMDSVNCCTKRLPKIGAFSKKDSNRLMVSRCPTNPFEMSPCNF